MDVLVVGSGPSGVQAALECLQGGASVGLVDIGYTDESDPLPEMPWSELQQLPKQERERIFAAPARQHAQAGVHLTPARIHMLKQNGEHFPLESKTFFALESTAQGGLGVGWGANAFVLNEEELERIGIPPRAI